MILCRSYSVGQVKIGFSSNIITLKTLKCDIHIVLFTLSIELLLAYNGTLTPHPCSRSNFLMNTKHPAPIRSHTSQYVAVLCLQRWRRVGSGLVVNLLSSFLQEHPSPARTLAPDPHPSPPSTTMNSLPHGSRASIDILEELQLIAAQNLEKLDINKYYEVVCELGKGTYGKVDLVVHKIRGNCVCVDAEAASKYFFDVPLK